MFISPIWFDSPRNQVLHLRFALICLRYQVSQLWFVMFFVIALCSIVFCSYCSYMVSPVLVSRISPLKALNSLSYQITRKLDHDNLPIWLHRCWPWCRHWESCLHRMGVARSTITCLAPSISISFHSCQTYWLSLHMAAMREVPQPLSRQYKVQAHQLRSDLRNTTKGDSLSQISLLASRKSKMHFCQLVKLSLYKNNYVILKSLPADFESIVTLISTKEEWFEFDKIESLLLAHEKSYKVNWGSYNVVASLSLSQASKASTIHVVGEELDVVVVVTSNARFATGLGLMPLSVIIGFNAGYTPTMPYAAQMCGNSFQYLLVLHFRTL